MLFGSRKTKPTEVNGGVELQVTRDNVEGTTCYLHPQDKNTPDDQGVFPYIIVGPGPAVELHVKIQGKNDQLFEPNEVVLNAEGTIVRWDKARIYRNSSYNFHVDFLCDEDWAEALRALGQAKVAVVRFKRPRVHLSEENCFDYAVSAKNKQLVAEVMTAFSALMSGREDETSQGRPHDGTPAAEPGPGGPRFEYGPFYFYGNGWVEQREGTFLRAPDVLFKEERVENFTIQGNGNAGFIVTNPDGTKTGFEAKDGRVHRKTIRPSGGPVSP